MEHFLVLPTVDLLDHRGTNQGLLVPDDDRVTLGDGLMIRDRAVPAVADCRIVIVTLVAAVLPIVTGRPPSSVRTGVASTYCAESR